MHLYCFGQDDAQLAAPAKGGMAEQAKAMERTFALLAPRGSNGRSTGSALPIIPYLDQVQEL